MTELVRRQAYWRLCRRALLVGVFAVPVLLGLGVAASSAEELTEQVASDDLSAVHAVSSRDADADAAPDTDEAAAVSEAEGSVDGDADTGIEETDEQVAEDVTAPADPESENEAEADGAEVDPAEAVTDVLEGGPVAEASERATDADEAVDEVPAGAVAAAATETVEQVTDEAAAPADPMSGAEAEVDATDVTGDVAEDVSGVVADATDSVDPALLRAVADDAGDAVDQVVDEVLIGAPVALLPVETAPIVDMVVSSVKTPGGILPTSTQSRFDGDADRLLNAARLQLQTSTSLSVRHFRPESMTSSLEAAWSASAGDSRAGLHVDQPRVEETQLAPGTPASGASGPPPQLSGFPMHDAMSHGSAGQSAAYLATIFALVPQPPHTAGAIGPERLKTQHTLEPVVAPG